MKKAKKAEPFELCLRFFCVDVGSIGGEGSDARKEKF
jgi:hypothetical protein